MTSHLDLEEEWPVSQEWGGGEDTIEDTIEHSWSYGGGWRGHNRALLELKAQRAPLSTLDVFAKNIRAAGAPELTRACFCVDEATLTV